VTSTFTTEFGHEYEQERGRWLRRRFLWYAGVSIGLNVISILGAVIALVAMLMLVESSSTPDAAAAPDAIAEVTPDTSDSETGEEPLEPDPVTTPMRRG
jgi:uncharacterized membrane protein YhaH (DUF805 family)